MKTSHPTTESFHSGQVRLHILVTGCLAILGLLSWRGSAQVSQPGPLVELSQPNPLGDCDSGFRFGAFTLNAAVEPAIAVNPIHPNNVVASWIFGPFQDLISGVSFDGGRSWTAAQLQEPRLPIALTRFRMPWRFEGREAVIASRATDETGYVQPSREELIAVRGTNSAYHFNGTKFWRVQADGTVTSVDA